MSSLRKQLNAESASEAVRRDNQPLRKLTPQAFLGLLLLVAFGYLGNYLNIPLFLGVNFLFGSIATLIVATLYGTVPGTISTLLISSYTFFLWGHPYAIAIFTFETAFVSWWLHRRPLNLVIWDSLYWLCLGIPLVAVFYGVLLEVNFQTFLLIALKQVVNGLLNALIADLLLTHTPLLQWLRAKQRPSRVSFQRILLNLLVAFVFFPALTLTVLSSRDALHDIEERIPYDLDATSQYLAASFQNWQQQQQQALMQLVAVASQDRVQSNDLDRLQESVTLLQPTLPGNPRLAVTNAQNRAIAVYPDRPSAAIGSRTFGTTATPLPNESGKLMTSIGAPGLGEEPVIIQQIPIIQDERRLGYAVSEVPGRFFLQLLVVAQQPSPEHLQVTLLDEEQRVLASTRDELERLTAFDHDKTAMARSIGQNIYQWVPKEPGLPVFARWQQSIYVQTTTVEGLPWTLMVEVPAAPHVEHLQIYYIQTLSITLAIVWLAIALAYAVSRSLIAPALRLAEVTTGLPDRLLEQEKIVWPNPAIAEMAALVRNFKGMARSLEHQFQTIQTTNTDLEKRIGERTQKLSLANEELKLEMQAREQVTEALQESEAHLREQTLALQQALDDLQKAQTQLIQTEKMSSLGQLVAGIAHEINNPVNFIHGNLSHVQDYARDLLDFVGLYQKIYANPDPAIQRHAEEIELDFLQEDLPKILASMRIGTERIRQIVLSLRTFSRTDESEIKHIDIHEGLDSTLLILQYRLKARAERPEIQVVREYAPLPKVECYPGPLNQVFMNLLANAIDALEEAAADKTYQEIAQKPSWIRIQTAAIAGPDATPWVEIAIADNGTGIPKHIQQRIFDPFFTTKPVGKGTGMGTSISYQIITEKHGGNLECNSVPGMGTKFIIQLPLNQLD